MPITRAPARAALSLARARGPRATSLCVILVKHPHQALRRPAHQRTAPCVCVRPVMCVSLWPQRRFCRPCVAPGLYAVYKFGGGPAHGPAPWVIPGAARPAGRPPLPCLASKPPHVPTRLLLARQGARNALRRDTGRSRRAPHMRGRAPARFWLRFASHRVDTHKPHLHDPTCDIGGLTRNSRALLWPCSLLWGGMGTPLTLGAFVAAPAEPP